MADRAATEGLETTAMTPEERRRKDREYTAARRAAMTPEERADARREADRRYRETHRAERREYDRAYRYTHYHPKEDA